MDIVIPVLLVMIGATIILYIIGVMYCCETEMPQYLADKLNAILKQDYRIGYNPTGKGYYFLYLTNNDRNFIVRNRFGIAYKYKSLEQCQEVHKKLKGANE